MELFSNKSGGCLRLNYQHSVVNIYTILHFGPWRVHVLYKLDSSLLGCKVLFL